MLGIRRFVFLFLCLVLTYGFENAKGTFGINVESTAKESPGSRIVAGWAAEEGQFPFQVYLRMINALGNQAHCGGSLVHHRWVLTAAHCLANRLNFIVRLGTVNNTRPAWMTETSRKYLPPGYVEEDSSVQTHDVGLLGLEHYIPYSDIIQPVRIQSSFQRNYDYTGEVFTAVGNGMTEDVANGGLMADEALQWVYLRGISEEDCLPWYPNSTVIDEHTLCAESYNDTAQSTCNGDSGAPLIIVDSDGVVTQVGIVSFRSPLGCNSVSPTGYVRPGHYHEWFTDITGVNFDWDYGNYSNPETSPTTTVENPNYTMRGGTPAAAGSIPSMVHILATRWSNSAVLKRCAGSLINDYWVLTSAGCLEDLRFLYVRIGVSFLPNPELVLNTGLIAQHTNWNSTTRANDIALVDLYRSADYSENIQSISLGVGEYELPTSGYFCGWGATENNTYSDELYCVNVTLMEQDDGTIIGYSTEGKATEFDMGAPLFTNGVLIGVVSRWPEADEDFAAVFSQPRYMIDWISDYSGLTFPETPDLGDEDEIPTDPEQVTDGDTHAFAHITLIIASTLAVFLTKFYIT